MGEKYLTMAEIERAFDKQWVLIDRPTSKRWNREVTTGGYVVAHSADRAELHRRLMELSDAGQLSREIAVFYIGTMDHEDPYGGFIFEEDP